MIAKKRGSGSKANVGRKKRNYKIHRLYKSIPYDIKDECKDYLNQKIKEYKSKLK